MAPGKLAGSVIHVRLEPGGRLMLHPHKAFVNLPNEPEAIAGFIKKWGPPNGDGDNQLAVNLHAALQSAWAGDKLAVEQVQQSLGGEDFRFEAGKRSIILRPKTLLGTVLLLFLRDHWLGKTAVCANPNCGSPYFIRKRRTQKYCEAGPCTEQAEREQKRDWWRQHRSVTLASLLSRTDAQKPPGAATSRQKDRKKEVGIVTPAESTGKTLSSLLRVPEGLRAHEKTSSKSRRTPHEQEARRRGDR